MNLSIIDWLIMLVYFVFVLGIGFALKRYMRTSNDFFLAGRSIPAWVCGLAFISANLGAQEVIGMGASGAKYGIITSHFYWIGAIPAMIFVGIFMMPFYYGSKARSVPEYLRLRFDEKTRAVNAFSFAVMTVLSSGISMYAMALLIQTLGLLHGIVPDAYIFHVSVFLSAIIVLGYIFLGGLTSAIYNEVLQFFLIVAGFAPLVWIGLRNVGGWQGIKQTLPANMTHSWQGMTHANTNTLGVEWSASSWASASSSPSATGAPTSSSSSAPWPPTPRSPPAASPSSPPSPKCSSPSSSSCPASSPSASPRHMASDRIRDRVVDVQAPYTPTMTPATASQRCHLFPSTKPTPTASSPSKPTPSAVSPSSTPTAPPSITTTSPFPSCSSTSSPPESSASASPPSSPASCPEWPATSPPSTPSGPTTSIRPTSTKRATDAHYLWMGRMATIGGVALSIGAAYLVTNFNNIMDALQLVFSIVNAPLFATFLLGMFWKRTTGHAAFTGLLSGTGAALLHHGLTLPADAAPGIHGGWITVLHHYPSDMAQNFWTAIFAFSVNLIVTIAISLVTTPRPEPELVGLVYSLTPKPVEGHLSWYQKPATLAVAVLAILIVLNLVFA